MKTTFDLPDALLRRAKALAAEQGRPLRNLVEEALDEKLSQGVTERRATPGLREGRPETWEEWQRSLDVQPDGTRLNRDAIAEESFFATLEALRHRVHARRNPFAGEE